MTGLVRPVNTTGTSAPGTAAARPCRLRDGILALTLLTTEGTIVSHSSQHSFPLAGRHAQGRGRARVRSDLRIRTQRPL